MISEQLYVWHHTHFIYDIFCTIHNVTSTLWVHTIVVTSLHPLHSWHHTHHTLCKTSHTWQHKSYICHLTLYIWQYIHCICVVKPSVSILLHPLSVWHYTLYAWHHIQYAWHHMNTLWHHTHRGMASHAVYLWHIQYVLYHPYCLMKTKRLYLASHSLYLTSQPSHLLYQCLQHNYGSFHTWLTYDTIQTLYHIKFRLYDINRQY